jgi:hypothetical protein
MKVEDIIKKPVICDGDQNGSGANKLIDFDEVLEACVKYAASINRKNVWRGLEDDFSLRAGDVDFDIPLTSTNNSYNIENLPELFAAAIEDGDVNNLSRSELEHFFNGGGEIKLFQPGAQLEINFVF